MVQVHRSNCSKVIFLEKDIMYYNLSIIFVVLLHCIQMQIEVSYTYVLFPSSFFFFLHEVFINRTVGNISFGHTLKTPESHV